ncbi:phage terminase large subunit [Wolbachia endosymbiont (group B) of Erebia ligea]|uniref:phage terminase large subunit n=1 Tax=Wolbachia endosymbiont (group B) of Erebia ligea TaxID=2954010 RepID=UPI00386302C9
MEATLNFNRSKNKRSAIDSRAQGNTYYRDSAHGGKLARFHQIVPIIESGKVFLPHQAVWLSDFEYEILMFPETRHDDQVDSAVQYLQWMRDSSFRVAAIRTL